MLLLHIPALTDHWVKVFYLVCFFLLEHLGHSHTLRLIFPRVKQLQLGFAGLLAINELSYLRLIVHIRILGDTCSLRMAEAFLLNVS